MQTRRITSEIKSLDGVVETDVTLDVDEVLDVDVTLDVDGDVEFDVNCGGRGRDEAEAEAIERIICTVSRKEGTVVVLLF